MISRWFNWADGKDGKRSILEQYLPVSQVWRPNMSRGVIPPARSLWSREEGCKAGVKASWPPAGLRASRLGSAETRARNEERNGKNVTILKRRSII